MNLEEAIKHCKEVACQEDKCGLEHKQLKKWLEELKIRRDFEIAEAAAIDDIEVDGDHPLQRLEELRQVLVSFLTPTVLQSLLDLRKSLDDGPEQFDWFVGNSVDGYACKFAIKVLEKFKKKRLDKVKELLQENVRRISELSDKKA
jgi:hypothetical protein